MAAFGRLPLLDFCAQNSPCTDLNRQLHRSLCRPHMQGQVCCRHHAAEWRRHTLRAARGASGDQANFQPDGSLDEIAEQLLAGDPEAQAQFRRVGDAARRVAQLQAEQAALEREMAAAATATGPEAALQERRQAQRASERMAEAQVRVAEANLAAAQARVRASAADQQLIEQQVQQDAERVESGKAAAIAAAGGTLGSLPYLLASGAAPLSTTAGVAACLVSCALFGVTYRYALRQDLGNRQLKGGVVAAFGLVRGLALADALQQAANGALLDVGLISQAALEAGESMLTFGFAAVALEVALQRDLLKPFGAAGTDQQ